MAYGLVRSCGPALAGAKKKGPVPRFGRGGWSFSFYRTYDLCPMTHDRTIKIKSDLARKERGAATPTIFMLSRALTSSTKYLRPWWLVWQRGPDAVPKFKGSLRDLLKILKPPCGKLAAP